MYVGVSVSVGVNLNCHLASAVVPEFAVKAALAVDALNRSPQGDVDSDEFFEAARLVWDGIRDIRHAVLMNRVRLSKCQIWWMSGLT